MKTEFFDDLMCLIKFKVGVITETVCVSDSAQLARSSSRLGLQMWRGVQQPRAANSAVDSFDRLFLTLIFIPAILSLCACSECGS